jgi:hypothetical protein
MWNPFKPAANPDWFYSPQPSEIRADTNSTVHANTVTLGDDTMHPDVAYGVDMGNWGDLDSTQSPVATYVAGDESRTLVWSPGPVMGYQSISTHDQSTPQDIGSVPGTNELNVHHGPVTGRALDVYQTGNRVPTSWQPPGIYGPVGRTEPDYATRMAYANFQEAFTSQSSDAVTYAQIAAI